MSRVDNVAKNVKFAAASQIVLAVVNFAVRRVFAVALGAEYMGLSGLFSDILSMLSLAELGFGTSIIYSLYRPVAEGDTEKIKSLMRLYQRAYWVIGAVVFVAGLALTPFLEVFVKEMPEGVAHIRWIYVLNVVNSAVSYFFIYKASLLFAYQKKYVEVLITTAVGLCAAVVKVAVLLVTGDYILYLSVSVLATLAQNAMVSRKTDRLYPYLRDKDVLPLEREDIQVIKRNVGGMVFHKVGDVAVFGTDSILMAKFVGVTAVGLYSNYMMIRSALLTAINMVYGAITPSMGNLNASGGQESKQAAFRHINFLSAWLFGWMCICLWQLFNPFITLWLGEEYLFSRDIVALIVANFYMYCMRIPVGTTKNAMGLIWNDRYKPVAEVIVNLVVSILLALRMGIAGVLLGTLISTVTVPFWVEPLVLYRHGLQQGVGEYFWRYGLYLAVTVLAGTVTGALCGLAGDGIGGFLVKMVVCGLVPHGVYFVLYHRTEEFGYLKGVVMHLAEDVVKRWKRGGRK